MYQFLADLVLTFHVLLVAFIVLGLVLILMGWLKHWAWVRNRRFRSLHLAAIGVVAAARGDQARASKAVGTAFSLRACGASVCPSSAAR